MIAAKGSPDPQGFIAALTAKASAIGEARAHAIVLRRSPALWRDARLIWPLFGDR